MTLFKTDLVRSFAIGFAIGTAALFVTLGGTKHDNFSKSMTASAVAAPGR
jgi:hypothetical protein